MDAKTDAELTRIAQEIVEEQYGTGEYKEGWKKGEDVRADGQFNWPSQVYHDKIMKRHRCCECGYGF
jgi:hypothetical protein